MIKALQNVDIKAYIALLIILIGYAIIAFGGLSDSINNRVFDLMFLVGTYFFGASHKQNNQPKL